MPGCFKCNSCGTVFRVDLVCNSCGNPMAFSKNPECEECDRALWFNDHHTLCPFCFKMADCCEDCETSSVREMRL